MISNDELRVVLLDFIKSNKDGVSRKDINNYIYPRLIDEEVNKNNKVRTSLTYLKNKNIIENIGFDTKSIWIEKK